MFGKQCGSQSIKISLQPRSANLILKVTLSDTERSLRVSSASSSDAPPVQRRYS